MFQTIVLAGGEGKRMGSSTPKVLHQLEGKSMLQIIIEKVNRLNPTKMIVISGKNASLYENSLKHVQTSHSPLHFVDQIPPNGTGDAVRVALPFLQEDVPNVLIVNADTPLIDDCLDDIVKRKPNTILVTRLSNPTGQGRICCDFDGNFEKIIEEKDADLDQKKINLVNCGVYYMEYDKLMEFIPLLDNNNEQKEYYITDIFKHFPEKVNLLEIPEESQWQLLNVNTKDDLYKAIEIWNIKNKRP